MRSANPGHARAQRVRGFVAIGLALLPAYWMCWRRPRARESTRPRAALTSILAFIVWWSFLIGHVLNNMRGFGS